MTEENLEGGMRRKLIQRMNLERRRNMQLTSDMMLVTKAMAVMWYVSVSWHQQYKSPSQLKHDITHVIMYTVLETCR